MRERMPIEDVIANFDDEALTRTMIATAAQGIGGLFNNAPARIQLARDRVVALMGAAPDLLAAVLKSQEIQSHYNSCQDCDDDGMLCERAGELEDEVFTLREAAITKAEGR